MGHEGPDYFSTKRAPKRDAQEIAEAHVYGQEAIGMIRFELIGEAGQLLGIAPAVRTGRGVDDGDYYLRVPVPAQPFRFRRNGQVPPMSRSAVTTLDAPGRVRFD